MAAKKLPKNIIEDLITYKLDELIEETDVCKCERCRTDIIAIALNKLPSRYVNSSGGDIMARMQALDDQMQANITTAILKAIEMVKKKPHHERGEY
jgi:competence protein ComFB